MLCLIIAVLLGTEPSDHWTGLIESRINRSLSSLGDAPTHSPLAMQEYLMTLGQIGDPAGAALIEPYLDDAALQAAALFAYGEMSGVAIDPLVTRFDAIKPANHVLLMEALAKLANGDEDTKRVVELFEKLDPSTRNAALFHLWPLGPDALKQQAAAMVTAKPNTPGALFYLYRTQVELPPELLLKILNDPGIKGEAQVFAARLRPNRPLPKLTARMVELTRAGDWRVRVYALSGLKRLDHNLFKSAALASLADVNPNVVNTALRLLVELGEDDIDANLTAYTSPFSAWHLETMALTAKDSALARYLPLVSDWGDSDHPWRRLRWYAFMEKAPADAAIDTELVKRFHQGASVDAELALEVLSERKYPKLESLMETALKSGDMNLTSRAMSMLEKDRMGGVTLEDLKKRTQRTFTEPTLQTAYLRVVRELSGEAAFETELARLAGHSDYAVRLKALSMRPNPSLDDRKAVFTSPWRHFVPSEVSEMAVQMIQRKQPMDWVLETTKGRVVIRLHGDYAPITSANITHLSNSGYYDGMPLHRVVPAFVVQGGDSRGNGGGDPGYTIPCEINPLRFRRGSVGMALSGKDTGGSQFFICHNDQPHLDGGYTVFGTVVEGMRVVDTLEEGDLVVKATAQPR